MLVLVSHCQTTAGSFANKTRQYGRGHECEGISTTFKQNCLPTWRQVTQSFTARQSASRLRARSRMHFWCTGAGPASADTAKQVRKRPSSQPMQILGESPKCHHRSVNQSGKVVVQKPKQAKVENNWNCIRIALKPIGMIAPGPWRSRSFFVPFPMRICMRIETTLHGPRTPPSITRYTYVPTYVIAVRVFDHVVSPGFSSETQGDHHHQRQQKIHNVLISI